MWSADGTGVILRWRCVGPPQEWTVIECVRHSAMALRMLDVARGHAVCQQYSGHISHEYPLRSSLSPDGRFVVSGSEDGKLSGMGALAARYGIYFWNAPSGLPASIPGGSRVAAPPGSGQAASQAAGVPRRFVTSAVGANALPKSGGGAAPATGGGQQGTIDVGYVEPLCDVAWHPLENVLAVCSFAPLQPIHLLCHVEEAPASAPKSADGRDPSLSTAVMREKFVELVHTARSVMLLRQRPMGAAGGATPGRPELGSGGPVLPGSLQTPAMQGFVNSVMALQAATPSRVPPLSPLPPGGLDGLNSARSTRSVRRHRASARRGSTVTPPLTPVEPPAAPLGATGERSPIPRTPAVVPAQPISAAAAGTASQPNSPPQEDAGAAPPGRANQPPLPRPSDAATNLLALLARASAGRRATATATPAATAPQEPGESEATPAGPLVRGLSSVGPVPAVSQPQPSGLATAGGPSIPSRADHPPAAAATPTPTPAPARRVGGGLSGLVDLLGGPRAPLLASPTTPLSHKAATPPLMPQSRRGGIAELMAQLEARRPPPQQPPPAPQPPQQPEGEVSLEDLQEASAEGAPPAK
ncbi:hypothetical protein PAPYR_10516 [Paratrimastix pyriformis]|uniref:Uncharacterized protein n=1 Tax=Paratrimastix pyriformis TaxID=342808 RepID=A0ABQ8U7L9_9EUKA|nr:hypothetical protein PAPYR_10516 [Paratrimastix pyriformis]